MRKYDLLVYTDGGCRSHKNGSQFGAWAYVFGSPDYATLVSQAGGKRNTTSMAMELTAIIKALKMLIHLSHNHKRIKIILDAKFIVDVLNNKQLAKWKQSNWKGSRGDIKNKELWQTIARLLKRFHKLEFEWVKGHSGDPGNEFVDIRLNKYIKRLEKRGEV